MNVLVYTSIWSLALRRKPHDLNPAEKSAVTEFSELNHEGRARLIGLSRQDLLSSIKSPQQFEKLRAALCPFPDEPLDTPDYEAAAQAGNACHAKGIVVSTVDILICAVALSHSWSIFSADPDFQNYAPTLRLKLHSPRK